MTYHSAVEAELARRRRLWRPLLVLALIVVLSALVLGIAVLLRVLPSGTPHYRSEDAHFRHGSIGAEPESGIPYKVWMALPELFPERFAPQGDYSAFGFLYDGETLPVGLSRRTVSGVDLVWFNCAVCHTGTVRETAEAAPELISGMPAQQLDLHGFTRFILDAAADPRVSPERLRAAMRDSGNALGPVEALIWRIAVFPRLREGMIDRAARLSPLLDRQPAWGPGRVDTFNPYKVLAFRQHARELTEGEVVGASDFPSIFLQGPREGMQLHWDGNNTSLAERNLSAALGAGVTPATADHPAIERIARWLRDLPPPPSPHRPDPAAVDRGRTVYARDCAGCHGWQGDDGYVFEGDRLGTVEPLANVGTDRARLDSYTQSFRDAQVRELFTGTPYAFRNFTKTDGYANAPLDGLWLRGPYLHNGSVPTLADLLAPPEARPPRFRRGSDVIDPQGGFVSPPCDGGPGCFDTTLRGNSNAGHLWGTGLPAPEKSDLLAYLLTF
ncbi:cytochrome c [Salipiger thiooxidans]|uniref:cytochrome c n=1 Tax=Salipiger thiooxidans TaxID=282683 RepID=UPI001CD282CE|nr:cytochrome c [Salipiger thiooxidans]MCA0845814.1 cytochrome c [Salipiger thiooxidans]